MASKDKRADIGSRAWWARVCADTQRKRAETIMGSRFNRCETCITTEYPEQPCNCRCPVCTAAQKGRPTDERLPRLTRKQALAAARAAMERKFGAAGLVSDENVQLLADEYTREQEAQEAGPAEDTGNPCGVPEADTETEA